MAAVCLDVVTGFLIQFCGKVFICSPAQPTTRCPVTSLLLIAVVCIIARRPLRPCRICSVRLLGWLSGVPQTLSLNPRFMRIFVAQTEERGNRRDAWSALYTEYMLILPMLKARLCCEQSKHDLIAFNIRLHTSLIECQFASRLCCSLFAYYYTCVASRSLSTYILCSTHPIHRMTGIPSISTYETLSYPKTQLLYQRRTHFTRPAGDY